MNGKNHVTMNVCTLVDVSIGLLYLQRNTDLIPVINHVFTDISFADIANVVINTALPEPLASIWTPIFAGAYWLGTLLPDIDKETSLLGRYIHIPVEHRTWTHTIWFLAPFVGLAFLRPEFLWLSLGYFLHLFWDSPSTCGVAWLYPFTKYRKYPNGAKIKKGHKIKLYKADGGKSERIFVSIFVFLSALCFVYFGIPLFG